jgi:hypothetical protein
LSGDILSTADALWSFNNPDDLGDDAIGTNDLTPVASPTSTGGALGYVADFEEVSNQYAMIADNAALSGSAQDILYCAWAFATNTTSLHFLGGKDDGTAGDREWSLYTNAGNHVFEVYTDTGSSTSTGAQSLGHAINTRELHCGGVDVSEKKSGLSLDGGAWTLYGAAWVSGTQIADGTADFSVAQRGDYTGTYAWDGTLGPAYFFKGTDLDFTTSIATVYNSGRGVACADLTEAEKTDLVSCWDMDEDGGPYLNTTQVDAVDYSTQFTATSSEYATSSPGPDFTDEDFAVCAWARLDSAGAERVIIAEDDVTNRNWGLRVNAAYLSYFTIFNGAGTAKQVFVAGDTWASGQRRFVCGYHDAAGDLVYVVNDNGTPSSLATGGGLQTDTVDLTVGAYGAPSSYFNGSVGPIWIWDGSYDTSDFATLYNSGIGYSCADTPTLNDAAEHCWEMDESGGPYADSVGSMTLTGQNTPTQATGLVAADPTDTSGYCFEGDCDLTAVNAPTRAAGLVEQSESGMAVNLVAASSQHLTIADNSALSLGAGESFTLCGWGNSIVSNWLNQGIGGKWHGATASLAEYTLYATTNAVNVGLSNGVTRTGVAASQTGLSGQQNVWHLLCGGLDNAGNLAFVQLDGTYSSSAYTNDAYDSATDFYVGNLGDSGSTYDFDGALDNVAFWSKALTEAELDSLWASGAGLFYSAYWDAYFSGDPIRFAWSSRPEIRRIISD